MKLYRYLLPLIQNDGTTHYKAEIEKARQLALDLFGGYTDGGEVAGAWRDESGKVYNDRLRVLDVGAEDTASFDVALFNLFYDQKAIFRAELGEVDIIAAPRPTRVTLAIGNSGD